MLWVKPSRKQNQGWIPGSHFVQNPLLATMVIRQAAMPFSTIRGPNQGIIHFFITANIPGGSDGKETTCQCRRYRRLRFDPWVGKAPWRRKWQPTPVFLPGEFHGQRSLEGYSPWGCKESDRTEQLTLSLSH